MAAVQFKIQDNVEDASNSVYTDQDKNTVITELMRGAIDHAERQRQHHGSDSLDTGPSFQGTNPIRVGDCRSTV